MQLKLHALACRMLRDEDDAADAVQDAFCRLWERELPATDDEARFKLFAVLKNVCISKLRLRKPTEPVDEARGICSESVYDESGRIEPLLYRGLSATQLRVFRMAVDDDLEYNEIARQLGMTVEAVRVNMCRARKLMRENYKSLAL